MVGNWISGIRTYNVLPKRDYGIKAYGKAWVCQGRVYYRCFAITSLISTIGLFYRVEGNCAETRKLLLGKGSEAEM